MTITTSIAIFFLLLSILLFLLDKSGRLDDSLERADRIASILAFLLAITLLIVPTLVNNIGGDTAVPNRETFLYQVQVQDTQTNNPIEDANVTISVPDTPPKFNQTDSNGYTNLEFVTTYLGKTAEISISAANYKTYTQFIELDNGLPHTILLNPQE